MYSRIIEFSHAGLADLSAYQLDVPRNQKMVPYQAGPRDPLVVGGAVLSMALLGIAASAIRPGVRSPSIHANSCAKSEA
jgi:hypothetical protein